mgnify:CR=1 FL=1
MLETKENYKFYRDFIEKVIKRGEECCKHPLKKEYKENFKQYVRRYMDNSTKLKDKKKEIILSD